MFMQNSLVLNLKYSMIVSPTMSAKCLILWIAYFVASSKANLVSWIEPCAPSDSACMIKSAGIALPYFARGVPELGVPALEPLRIKDTKADTGELKVRFRNAEVDQLSKCKFESITRDPVKSTASITVNCPIIFKGDYTIGGKIFFLDVEGDGKFYIGGGRLRASVDLKLKTFKDKEGKKHYKVGSFDYTYEPLTKFDIKFENLFNGDRTKADPIEKVIAESWKELILDVGKPLLKEGILGIANSIDKCFKAVPAEQLEIA